jgi:DNA-binding response OmpR family regulator
MNRKLKIGIVQNEPSLASSLTTDLEASGYQVLHTSNNYDVALANINKQPPHLLILDTQLQGIKSGLDIAEHLNKINRFPLVLIVGQGDEQTSRRIKNLRPLAIINKPLDSGAVMGYVRNILYEAN